MKHTAAVREARGSLLRIAWVFAMAIAAHTPLSAHRYTEPQASDLRDTYSWIKERAQESFRREFANLRLAKNEPVDFAVLQLQWLDSDSAMHKHGGPTKQQLFVALAFQVVSVREVLTRAGYPTSQWAARLATFEEKYIAAISRLPSVRDVIQRCALAAAPEGRPFFDRLLREQWTEPMDFDPGPQRDMALAMLDCEQDAPIIEDMEGEIEALLTLMSAYQSRNPSKAAPIEFQGAYGGTVPAAVRIVWRPERGELRVITNFDYDLCARLALDADDPRQCARWRDVLGDELEQASEYRYFARWPDGRTRSGTISVKFSDDRKDWILSAP